jgi:CRISPR-associated protein Cmr3
MPMRWFEIDPLDTLFFRGAEPMEPGETHVQSLEFPPLPQTLIGAVRTAALSRAGVTFAPGWQSRLSEEVRKTIGADPAPPATFSLFGPLFAYGGEPLYPVPADWRRDTTGRVVRLTPVDCDVADRWGIRHVAGSISLPWLRNEVGKDGAVRGWVTADGLAAGDRGDIPTGLVDPDAVFDTESRVGLALDGRRAKEGHLYSTSHIRLRSGVTMVFGLDGVPASVLPGSGLLQWGGEQRLVYYREREPVAVPRAESGSRWVAVVPFPAEKVDQGNRTLRLDGAAVPLRSWVAEKFRKVGGWDLAKREHKSLQSWFPAGTVLYPVEPPTTQRIHLAERQGLLWV